MDYFDETGLYGRDKEIMDELWLLHQMSSLVLKNIRESTLPERDKSNYASYFTDLLSEIEHDALVTRENADYSMETRDED